MVGWLGLGMMNIRRNEEVFNNGNGFSNCVPDTLHKSRIRGNKFADFINS